MLPCRDPGLRRAGDLLEHRLGLLLAAADPALEESAELGGDHFGDDPRGGWSAEHLLRLALELWLRQPDRDHRGQALKHVLLQDRLVPCAQYPGRPELLVQCLDQRPLEPRHVRAALGRGNDVHERPDDGVVSGVPAQGDIDLEFPLDVGRRHVAEVVEDGNRFSKPAGTGQPQHVGHRLAGAQLGAEFADAAAEMKLDGPRQAVIGAIAGRPVVGDGDRQARDEVGGLPCPLNQCLDVNVGSRHEDLPVWPEPGPRPGARLGHLADLAQARSRPESGVRPVAAVFARHAPAEAGRPLVALPVHVHIEPVRQCVDDGCPDAVQSARSGVRAAAELAAGMQSGHDELDAVQAGLRLDVDRDAAAVVVDLGRVIGMQGDFDLGARTVQGLIDRVVDDLPQAMLHAPAIGRADIHAGPLTHRVETLENRQMPRRVAVT